MNVQSHPILASSFRTAGSLTSAMSGQLEDEDDAHQLTEPLLHEEEGEVSSGSKPPPAQQVRAVLNHCLGPPNCVPSLG